MPTPLPRDRTHPISFLAAQAADPFDPAPMQIWADHLEEHGDATGAWVLRWLVEGGTPSLHALALDAALISSRAEPDAFNSWRGGCGSGDGDWLGDDPSDGSGSGDGYDREKWSGFGSGFADDFAFGANESDGYGEGEVAPSDLDR